MSAIRLMTILSVAISTAAAQTSLTVRLFNFAGVPTQTVLDAERQLHHVFEQAGIVVTSLEGDVEEDMANWNDFSARPCPESLPAAELIVKIIPASPPTLNPAILGQALPCAAFGAKATIFWDHVEAKSHGMQATIGQILGYAMAHEIGHVLLRSSDHGAEGVMRSVWGAGEWSRVAAGGLTFTTSEALRMRSTISLIAAQSQ